MSPIGWTAYDATLTDEPHLPPLLGRVDIRVTDADDDLGWSGNGGIVLLLSDQLAEVLGVHRRYRFDRSPEVPVAGLRASEVGWWNEVGRLAGIVVLVGSWVAAGIVGNSVYDALRVAVARARTARTEADTPLIVMSAREAESMACWVTCAEFHSDDCDCVADGRGQRAVAIPFVDDDDDELADDSTESYDFDVRLIEARIADGVWSVVLREVPLDAERPEFECEVSGITGSTFFVAARRREVTATPPPWPKLGTWLRRAVHRRATKQRGQGRGR